MEILLVLLGIVGIFVLATLYSALTWGIVMQSFWVWFLIPVFPQLHPISYMIAVGLAFFVFLFHNHGTSTIKKEYRDDSPTVSLILNPWLMLLMGYLVHLFIS